MSSGLSHFYKREGKEKRKKKIEKKKGEVKWETRYENVEGKKKGRREGTKKKRTEESICDKLDKTKDMKPGTEYSNAVTKKDQNGKMDDYRYKESLTV